jgi:hypothetical protein
MIKNIYKHVNNREENTFSFFVKSIIITLFLSFLLINEGCKKDHSSDNPSIYYFYVIDYYSGLPVVNAKAILHNDAAFGSNPDQVIGHTDANGIFQYDCKVETITIADCYSSYDVYFLSENCPLTDYTFVFSPEHISVDQTHTSKDVTIRLFQSSIVHLTTKRISIDPMNLGSHFCGFGVSSADYHSSGIGTFTYHAFHKYYLTDTINQIHDTCYCVPSEVSEFILSYILFDCGTWASGQIDNSSDTIHIPYNDTVNFNILY